MYYIGIDIGGMSIKGGLVTENGELVLKQSIVTRPTANEDVIIDDIHKLICSLLENKGLHEYQLSGVGIGVPGTVDGENGRVRFTPNINFKNTPLVEKLSARFQYKFPIRISNDANCAALGEAVWGGGGGVSDSITVTLGTGVGTGFYISGKLFEGVGGAGTEGGHIVIKTGGEKCGCGRRGCWEAYAAAPALIRQVEAAIAKNPDSVLAEIAKEETGVTGKTVFEAVEKGCPVAAKVLKKYVSYVGDGLVNLVNIFRPKVIIMGGGVSMAGDALIKPLQRYVSLHSFASKYSPKTKIVQAKLGNDAGIMGAATLTMNK